MAELTEEEVVSRAADAVVATQEWQIRWSEARAPYQTIIDISRRVLRAYASPYPKRAKGESSSDFAKREHQWKRDNLKHVTAHKARITTARAMLEKIDAEMPAPLTADGVVELHVKGNLRLWGEVMNKVSSELYRRGVFTRNHGGKR